MADVACAHIGAIDDGQAPAKRECEECVKIGASWVHLRTCQACGTTLCCDTRRIGTPASTRARLGIR